MCERDVSNYPFTEECGFPHAPARSIKELVGNDHIGRGVFFLQAANRRHRQNVFDAEQLHRVYVRPEGNLGGKKLVSASVPRKERNSHALKLADDECIRRRSERRLHLLLSYILKLGHLIKTRASDYSDMCFFHYGLVSSGANISRSKIKYPSSDGLPLELRVAARSLSAFAFEIAPILTYALDRSI